MTVPTTPQDSQFDEPLVALRRRIEELEGYPEGSGREGELRELRKELARETERIFSGLNRWQKALVARHPDRPYTLDYVRMLTEEWVELHGDRAFGDDAAIVAGLARFRGRSVAIVGHHKGRGTKERITRNFGQPRPEGYRKALRVMQLAERFGLPVITLIDTAGAYPGLDAEERGQAEAIARNLLEMAGLRVPIVVAVTGEGGSGGALGIAVGDRILMHEFAVYSVIPPEGCAALLWRDTNMKVRAAEALKITAPDLLGLGVIDEIVKEPVGGAHTDPAAAGQLLDAALSRTLAELAAVPADRRLDLRYEKFRAMGRVGLVEA